MYLISAAGGGGTNQLIKEFKNKFIGITNDKYKLFTSFLKTNILVPDASCETEYITKLNEIIQSHNIKLFIPNSDLEVLTVSKYKANIKCKLFLPNSNLIQMTYDKWTFHQALTHHNIKSAKTFLIESYDDVYKAFEIINQKILWCRARLGSGSSHTSKVNSPKDAIAFISHCVNAYKMNINDFLISEYLPGDDYAVLSLWNKGELKLMKMAKRSRYIKNPGESPPNIIESFYNKDLEEFIKKSILTLDKIPEGILNIDLKCYEDGSFAITEINPGRFYYNMPLFNSGKYNTFEYFLKLANGENFDFIFEDPEVIFIREMDNEPRVISTTYYNSILKKGYLLNE